MMMLVSYDVAVTSPGGQRRLRRISRVCLDFGQRVQASVFEIEVDPAQWTNLRATLLAEMDPMVDSLRFYRLGSNWRRRVEHIGANPTRDLGGPLVF
ncbi:MAG: CRISPR-associated endonuclease Cas2 [Pseudomonadota bacterium]